MKGRPWTETSLTDVGGIEGVGVTFLEETFSSKAAPPTHRLHQPAIRAVLQALLPEQGTNIKGRMRSYAELLAASGYSGHREDFDALLGILDGEVRLVTPTEPDDDSGNADSGPPASRATYFQLAHDYLVPSLREWLNRKQKETRRGRAELQLAERAALWNAKPENRHLPSLVEWARIRTLTEKRKWTEPQRRMMNKAGRLHLARTAIGIVFLLLLGWGSLEFNGRLQARALVKNLVTAKEDAVLGVVGQLEPYHRWAKPLLEQQLATEPKDAEDELRQLHVRIALLQDDASQAETIKESLLNPTTPYAYVGVLRDALSTPEKPVSQELVEQFRSDFNDESLVDDERFRAGLVLATYAPAADDLSAEQATDDFWTAEHRQFLAEQLIQANLEQQPILRQCLSPMGTSLLDPLETLFADTDLPETQQLGAANAVAEFAAQDGRRLAQMLSVATPAQYQVLYAQLVRLGQDAGEETLRGLVSAQPAEDLPPDRRVALGQERAGAAITLLRQGARREVFAALRVQDDPESLTQFVHRCRAREVAPQALLECLNEADKLRQTNSGDERQLEDQVLFGLLLALGEYTLDELPQAVRQPQVERLADWYRNDPSSTIHGATGWLLRHWGQNDIAREIDQTPVPYSPDRQWYTLEIKAKTGGLLGIGGREQSTYMTFIVIPAGEYEIGSPPEEPERDADENRHAVRITRPFDILDREVTWTDAALFDSQLASRWGKSVEQQAGWAPLPDEPWVTPQWYDAVRFCRWLTEQTGRSEGEQAYANPATLDRTEYPPDPNPKAGGAPLNWPLMGLDRSGFRLPTEAEWEVACRAGTTSAWSYGGDVRLADQYSWFNGNSSKQTHDVRGKRPNLRGLFDLHGNASEWCHDWYAHAADGDPKGPATGSLRVFRGGSWGSDAWYCRSSLRIRIFPAYRNFFLGFRVATVPSGELVRDQQSGADSEGREARIGRKMAEPPRPSAAASTPQMPRDFESEYAASD